MDCPECRQQMRKVRLVDYNLVVEACPARGSWIDRGQDQRVTRLMDKESRAVKSRLDSQDRWAGLLTKIQSSVSRTSFN